MVTISIASALTACAFFFILSDMFGWYFNLIARLPQWVNKPLGMCPTCFAGQLTLWTYYFYIDSYNIVEHLFAIILTITFAHFLTKLYERVD